ncbi:hypothetical protein [[Mycobacterium] nativiensis]|uniref:Uncharacterized protein n=1 Tax=[Mycobacterium] nativiensis TaxID=2855503 RepID=A0ABU5XQD5_9MYCO|nr:hypothetical protein [Mycolicibacter sp. MYC340]MEB3029937.1 hypothetical protein [Mycolicibacter sp. MYC340]
MRDYRLTRRLRGLSDTDAAGGAADAAGGFGDALSGFDPFGFPGF